MAQLIYSSRAFIDLERLTDFLIETDPVAALATVDLITEAVQILENHPLIGRPAENGLRELVISRGRSGYLALYSHEQEHDTVLVLAVRHQREAGFSSE
ncbi:type II toxin-antitoxin system RelE/ParE family toxin [Variovorax sp. LARHSF232]